MIHRDLFTDRQRAVLVDLQARDQAERDAGIREPMSLKALRPQVAELLVSLILAKDAKTVAEFGTSHGYSTIHLAAAARRTGGHVHSVEAIPEKTQIAAANLQAAGLHEYVTLVAGDGETFAAKLPGAIDLVLVDYGVPAFAPAFASLRSKIAPGGLMFIDGGGAGYWESPAVTPFKHTLEADPDFLVSTVQMHREQLIAVRL